MSANLALGGSATGAIAANSTTSATGVIVGNILTISGSVTGTFIPGCTISGTGVTSGTTIVQQISGTPGGDGVYFVSVSQTVASTTITGAYGVLTISGTVTGTFSVGALLSGTSVPSGCFIIGLGSGTGGDGTYYVNTNTVVASTTISATLAEDTVFVAQGAPVLAAPYPGAITGWLDEAASGLGGSATGVITSVTASSTATIAGNVLTTSGTVTGTFMPGGTLSGTGVTAGTTIVQQLTGTTGGSGTYEVSIPQTVASTTISVAYGLLTLSGTVTGTFILGATISGTGVPSGNSIIGLGTGTGGVGTYYVSNSTAVSSTTITATTGYYFIDAYGAVRANYTDVTGSNGTNAPLVLNGAYLGNTARGRVKFVAGSDTSSTLWLGVRASWNATTKQTGYYCGFSGSGQVQISQCVTSLQNIYGHNIANSGGTTFAANSVYWGEVEVVQYSGASSPVAWAANTAYSVGTIVTNGGSQQYICLIAGTSASSGGPTGSTPQTNSTPGDGTVLWAPFTPGAPCTQITIKVFAANGTTQIGNTQSFLDSYANAVALGFTNPTFSTSLQNLKGSAVLFFYNHGLVETGPGALEVAYHIEDPFAANIFITGSSTATIAAPLAFYTINADGYLASPITVTPTDGGAGGTFTPATLTFNSSVISGTVAYTAAAAGTVDVTTTNTGGLNNPSPGVVVTVPPSTTVYTNSPAFVFSPGNWIGDNANGRGSSGTLSSWMQAWCQGAWFEVNWLAGASPTAMLYLSNTLTGQLINYQINNDFVYRVAANAAIILNPAYLIANGVNRLKVWLDSSPQISRWNATPGGAWSAPANTTRVNSLILDSASSVLPASTVWAPSTAYAVGAVVTKTGSSQAYVATTAGTSAASGGPSGLTAPINDGTVVWSALPNPANPWVMIFHNSIGEGIGAENQSVNHSFVYSLQVLLGSLGIHTCQDGCGYSGYIYPGDSTGDVPPLYLVQQWTANTAYAAGDVIINGSQQYVATSGGTSASSGGGPTGTSYPITDGTVTWGAFPAAGYAAAGSRWNVIAPTGTYTTGVSRLDSAGKLSAYGSTNQQPIAIFVMMSVNENLHSSSLTALRAAVAAFMAAARAAAPNAIISICLDFGHEWYSPAANTQGTSNYLPTYTAAIQNGFNDYVAANPTDTLVAFHHAGTNLAARFQGIGNISGDNVHPLREGQILGASIAAGWVHQDLQLLNYPVAPVTLPTDLIPYVDANGVSRQVQASTLKAYLAGH